MMAYLGYRGGAVLYVIYGTAYSGCKVGEKFTISLINSNELFLLGNISCCVKMVLNASYLSVSCHS